MKRLSFFRKRKEKIASFFFFFLWEKVSMLRKKPNFKKTFLSKNSFKKSHPFHFSFYYTLFSTLNHILYIASFSSWAKFYSKVTIPFCRLPLLTFCSLTRGFSPKTPVADSGTTWLENYFFFQFIPVDFQGELKRDGKGWNFFGINHQIPFWGF